MEKIDLRKDLRAYYKASFKAPAVVDVPDFNFLMIDGKGDPNTSQEFRRAMEALYSLAYTMKFSFKLGERGVDFSIMPLEGLWWVEEPAVFSMERKDDWLWTMMVLVPDLVTPEDVLSTAGQVKKKREVPAVDLVRLERFAEGRCAQILHIGPYSEEGPTVEKLHSFIEEMGGALRGKHHEIYMSDPRRAAPEKWKTIVRQPFST